MIAKGRAFRLKQVLIVSVFGWLCQSCSSLGLTPGEHAQSKPVVIGQHIPQMAPALVQLPDNMELISIDGQTVPLLSRRANLFVVPPGVHRFEVRYLYFWDLGPDDHEIVRSDTKIIEANLLSGARYHFETPPDFESADQARQQLPTQEVRLIHSSKLVHVAQSGKRKEQQPSSAMKTRNQLIENNNPHLEETQMSVSNTLETMKSLWQKLSPGERTHFKNFIESDGH